VGSIPAILGAVSELSFRRGATTAAEANSIQPTKQRATFAFKAIGSRSGFQCALFKKPQTRPPFSGCTSPRTYQRLSAGTYTFEVRAFNAGGTDLTPAKRPFSIS
jgi:hypothetical protein